MELPWERRRKPNCLAAGVPENGSSVLFGLLLLSHERANHFLRKLGLAPRAFLAQQFVVHDGMVTEVSVFISNGTRRPLSLSQKMPLPAGCSSNPCVKPAILPTKALVSIMVVFNDESEFRNRMPEAIQTACLSRLHGCSTYEELTAAGQRTEPGRNSRAQVNKNSFVRRSRTVSRSLAAFSNSNFFAASRISASIPAM